LQQTDAPESVLPEAAVIVPGFNHLKLTLWCLHALLSGSYRCSFEILVVDDASQDATLDVLERLPLVRHVHSATNQGFAHSCNLGARSARGRYLVFLNNDTLPLQAWLDALVETFRDRPEAGVVGSKLVYPDGRLQEAGGIVWQGGAATNYGKGGDRTRPEFNYLRSVDYCSGAAIAVPADRFHELGGFDVSLSPAYGEDLDLALRLRERGHPALYQPFSEVVHLEGATAGTSTRHGVKAAQVRNLEKLFERWRPRLRSHRPEGKDARFEKDRDAERRVLFVDAFTLTPDQDAGSLDGLHWLQSLAAIGFQPTYVPNFDFRHIGGYTTDLQRLGIECVYAPHYATPEDFLAEHGAEFDLCVFYRFHVAAAILPVVERHAPQARRLLALCDLHHLRTHREATLRESARGVRASLEDKFRELLACARCDGLWTPSEFEREVLRKEIPGAQVFVWPLAQELRPPQKPFADRAGIGYLGGFKHPPNVDAVLYFIDAILPRVLEQEPDMTFLVAGSQMPPEISGIDRPAVKILGHVADLRTFFEELRVFVAPVRYGAGVKGKVVASLASGVPVVGTAMAFEGMGLGHEEGAVVAETPEDFAAQIVRIHRSEELWKRLSQAGFARAEREYSVAAGTKHLARAVVQLGVGTRRAYELIGGRQASWLDLPGMELDVCRTQTEYLALKESETCRRRRELEEALLRGAENGCIEHRGYSLPASRAVVYRAEVATDPAGKRRARWREDLLCPITGLNNRQRALAAFAEALVLTREHGITDVYLTEQVTALYEWMAARFRTVNVVGSEYLGPQARGGEIRDGIRHQDVERLAFDAGSMDLIVSGDVLEHVNDPRRALAEFARVLRPGGHLLFTVPFCGSAEKNTRRARTRDGAVEHLVDPCYHDNPLDPGGSLAFFDFGWELLEWVAAAGFRDVSALCCWSAALGHLGGILEIFYARRA
jgi:GT2 family glycosyltransferase/SAM-dependent methyltransferase